MDVIAPRRRSQVQVPRRHRGARHRTDTATDQCAGNHADRAADQADDSAGTGAGRRAAGGAVRLPVAAPSQTA